MLNVPKAWKSFWMHPIELLGDVDLVESRFAPFGNSVSVSARYVHGFTKRTIDLEIILDTTDGTAR